MAQTSFGDPSQPGRTPLTLGGVPFGTEECPSDISFGGKQVVTTKELDGGGRVTMAHGSQPKPISWKGTFWHKNVKTRVQALRAFRDSGADYLVEWSDERYYVKITDFDPTFHDENRCDYDITVVVTRSANGTYSISSPVSLDAQVSSLLTVASTQYATLVENDPTGIAIDPVTPIAAAVQSSGPLAQTAGTSGSSLLAATSTGAGIVSKYLSTLLETSTNFVPATRLLSAITLIARNVQQGQTPTTITKQGGSLFEVASLYYGDITKAFALASVLGVSTPRLTEKLQQSVPLPPFGTRS